MAKLGERCGGGRRELDRPAINHMDLTGKPPQVPKVVSYQQHPDLISQDRLKQSDHPIETGLVEPSQWLVPHQELRPVNQRPAQSDPLDVPPAQTTHRGLPFRANPEPIQHRRYRLVRPR